MKIETMRWVVSLLLLGAADERVLGALSLEQPSGTSLTAGDTVYFGAVPFRYHDPVETVRAGDDTFTATFTGIPRSIYSTYEIQRSVDGESEWTGLFAPGLEPDLAGTLVYQDDEPLVSAFYRLLVITDMQREFTIRNTGSGDLTGLDVSLLGDDSGLFELNLIGMESVLMPGGTTTFTITYLAEDPEPRSAELQVVSSTEPSIAVHLAGSDPPLPPPSPTPVLVGFVLTPALLETPAGLAGEVVDGPAFGDLLLEVSSGMGEADEWNVIVTIPLDEAGGASFGQPDPVPDPESVGSPRRFYRLRVK